MRQNETCLFFWQWERIIEMYHITLLCNFDHLNCDYRYRGLYISINDLFLDRICYIKNCFFVSFRNLWCFLKKYKLHGSKKWEHLFYGLNSIHVLSCGTKPFSQRKTLCTQTILLRCFTYVSMWAFV